MDEVSPPRGKIPDLAAKAHLQGDWLDRGYRFIRWGGELLYAGVLLFPLLMIFGFIAVMKGWFSNWVQLGTDFSATLGTIVAGSGVGLLALGGRFSKLALGFRPIVRVALDVDNWLREHPRDSNPTARICGRYASLLRYISQWRDDEGKPYQALIIFAHSQGTVITADLLRFLRTEANARGGFRAYDSSLADLDRLPVYLFTMGCPLRQLYGLRFPYLYGYVPTAPGAATLPDPDDLGVSLWVNAYRTADYVGRDLWRTHPWQPIGKISDSTWNPAAGMPKHVWAQGKRVEFSIGPGAHTHYWDETAEAIAEALDVLIARAPFPNLPAPVGGQNGNQVVETLG